MLFMNLIYFPEVPPLDSYPPHVVIFKFLFSLSGLVGQEALKEATRLSFHLLHFQKGSYADPKIKVPFTFTIPFSV